MSYDDTASGAWHAGLAPIFPHELPQDQESRSALGKLVGTPLDTDPAKLDIEDVASRPGPSAESEHQSPVLDGEQDVIITATILPSMSTPSLESNGHASEKVIHGYGGPERKSDDLLEAKYAFPALVTSILHEGDKDISRVEHAPLLAHECLGSSQEDVAMMSSVPSISLTTLDDSSYRIPAESSIEKFPTDGKGIIEFIKMTERRLSEDLTSDDGSRISSPSHMPTTSVDNIFSMRPRSASSEHSPRLDKIPEEYDLRDEVDTPDHIMLDSRSKTSVAAPNGGLEAPLQSPFIDSVSGASLLGHEILLGRPNEMEGISHCYPHPLLAHEAAGQDMQGDIVKFPLRPASLTDESKQTKLKHHTAQDTMTINNAVPGGGPKTS